MAKIQANGASLLYSSYLGGTGADYSGDIAVNNQGMAYIAGRTLSSNFPTESPLQARPGGFVDVFVSKFDTTKSGAASLIYSSYLGGASTDAGDGHSRGWPGQYVYRWLHPVAELPGRERTSRPTTPAPATRSPATPLWPS